MRMSVVVAYHTQAKSIEEVEEAESLYKELFSSPTSDGSFGAEFVDLCKTTTIGQRLTQVDTQPENMADVYPRHKHLVVKRSRTTIQKDYKKDLALSIPLWRRALNFVTIDFYLQIPKVQAVWA